MPELPDVEIYCERITKLFGGQSLLRLQLKSPFLLRSVGVAPKELEGLELSSVTRIGKRLVFDFSDDVFAVLHLMIAGRLHLKPPGVQLKSRQDLAAWEFASNCLVLTEAGTKKRASLHLVRSRSELVAFDRGGLETLTCTFEQFAQRVTSENRTLKRALTDPRLLSGIGNAYSDEILHDAGLSPVTRTSSLSSEQLRALFKSTKAVLRFWTTLLRKQVGDGFPEKVTAFRPEMSVHGRYGKPCVRCSTPIQRIRYAANEVNYCPTCQTGGKLLVDRGLSRLLKGDWPKSLDELEELKESRR